MVSSDWADLITAVLAGAVRRGAPLAYAAIGEAVSERSGVMNLGVEGMMLVGAMSAAGLGIATGNPWLAVLGGGLVAMCLAALHALFVVYMGANQIVSGFALTILGGGLSGFFGRPFVGVKFEGFSVVPIPFLSSVPLFGQVFFQHDVLTYASVPAAAAIWFLIYRTRFGLRIRAAGEAPDVAYAVGVKPLRIRFLAVLIGGFLAGVGGAHLSIAYTHLWAEQMTAGQGWIAIGLVIVAGLRPQLCVPVAWLFGGLAVLQAYLQAIGIGISPYLVAMFPYGMSVIALTAATIFQGRAGYGLPAALGKPFRAGA